MITRDFQMSSNTIRGYDLVNWQAWKYISEPGIPVRIFTTGEKFISRHGLTCHTTYVGSYFVFLARFRDMMSLNGVRKPVMRVLDLA
jgi:hypothetical protein